MADFSLALQQKDNNGTWVCTYQIIHDSEFKSISAISTRIRIQQKIECMKLTGMFLWPNDMSVIQVDC